MHVLSSYIDKEKQNNKGYRMCVTKVVNVFQLVSTYFRIKAHTHTHTHTELIIWIC